MEHPELEDAQAFHYPWPPRAWQRRRDFHGWYEPLAQHLEQWIRTSAPDLIHVQNLAAFRPTLFGVLARCGVPVLMTVHDFSLANPDPAARSGAGLRGSVRRFLDRRSLVRARQAAFRAVACFLSPTCALIQEVGLPAARSRLHRLPISLAESAPWRAADTNKSMNLLFAGTLYRSKGVDLLLDALAQARGPAAGATLDIAGEGDQRQALEAQVGALGLGGRVRFLGHVAPEAIERAYAACDLFVLPSRVPENSPLTVLEAGARGRPSLASGRGGIPELLGEERGWTFRSGDVADLARALERAVSDPAELRARGTRMRTFVRAEFDPGRHWEELEAVRQEFIAGAAR